MGKQIQVDFGETTVKTKGLNRNTNIRELPV
jgi:hypothetical protein